MTTRRLLTALLAPLLVLTILTGCTGSPTPATEPEGTALVLEHQPTPVTVQLTPADKIAEGSIVLISIVAEPVILRAASVLTGQSPTILGLHLVDLSAPGSATTALPDPSPLPEPGITRTYPPAGVTLLPLEGAELRPEHRYQLMIGLQGAGQITGIRLRYETGGLTFEQVLPHQLTLELGNA